MQTEIISKRRDNGINWESVITLVIFHAGALAALFMFSWKALIVSLIILWVAGGFGIGMGYHRLLTHRGYKTPKWMEYVLTVCGTLALQSGTLQWVTTHRIHHAHTETEQDPHTPRQGTWWSHIGWILRGTAQKHDLPTIQRYAPDLLKDRFHVWISRYYYVPIITLGLVLLVFGGWSMFMWGIFLRTVVGLHVTWLVNSATHMWGTRRFVTEDDSRNNMLIALLAYGEGWHNNHHAHPTAARHGLAWYEIDMNWWGIRTLQLLGLAKSIKLISSATIRASAQDKRHERVLKKAA
ncbi:MAG TPA: fatty acid desaturase [Pyrinomonadaceae bacterium]|nr:fatty acid desaturase [Pyrinomonadaceae bacterium]